VPVERHGGVAHAGRQFPDGDGADPVLIGDLDAGGGDALGGERVAAGQ
jgi:hypothetical protein